MKVPMRWLKEYTEIPLSAADYAEKMIMAGNGVEGIENTGDLFDHVVVGHVLSCEDIPENQDIELLVKAFERMALRKKLFEESRNEEIGASLSVILTREPAPVTEKITIVINRITKESHVPLDDIFTDCTSRSELVATFLAILELMKSQKITADFSDDPEMPRLRLINEDDITDNPISEGGLPE